jgi:hypothetical protein
MRRVGLKKNDMKKTKHKKYQSGFSTLEIVIAAALMSIVIGSAILVIFSNQSILIDSELSRIALVKAKILLQKQEKLAKEDFNLINATSSTHDEIYHTSIEVAQLPDFFTKLVTARTSWNGTGNRTQHVTLSGLLGNTGQVAGGDTCSSSLVGDWNNPVVREYNLANLVGDNSGTYPITDIDAYENKLYVTANNTSRNKETFFVFDITNQFSPVLISKLDNDVVNNTGLVALAVARTASGTYGFVASASSFVKGQLQIIDISANTVLKTYKIPLSIVNGSSSQGTGNSIIYKNGYVFLGLKKTISGPEFNIIDVRDPLDPFWVGGYSVGNAINSMLIKKSFVYLATPNDVELTILNIENLLNPVVTRTFDAPDTVGNGKSLYSVGDTLYLGRTVTSQNPEFLVLTNPDLLVSAPNLVASREIGGSVNGLIVRSNLAFILTNSQFHILSLEDLSNINQFISPITLSNRGGTPVPSFDCEGNHFFIGSNDASNKGYVSIITAS